MGEPMDLNFENEPDAEVQAVFLEYEQSMLDSGSSGVLAAMYRQAYDDAEELTRQLKFASAKKTALADQLYDRMISEGLTSIRTEDGTFSAEEKPACVIVKGMEEFAFEMLEEAGLGNVIKRVVNWQTLNKIHRDGEIEKLIEADPEHSPFKFWTRKTIRIRRA